MLIRRTLPLLVTTLGLLIGCKDAVPEAEQGNFVRASQDDPAFNEAKRKAKETYSQFVAAFKAKNPKHSEFTLKKAFKTGPNDYEHIWIDGLSYDGKQFTGTLANDPVDLKGYKYGDKVTIAVDEVSDWMYVEDRTLVGGYTMRAHFSKVPPDQRAKMLEQLPFKIEGL